MGGLERAVHFLLEQPSVRSLSPWKNGSKEVTGHVYKKVDDRRSLVHVVRFSVDKL